MPGVSANELDLWDAQDAEDESITIREQHNAVDVNGANDELKNLKGKTIKFIGDIKSSLVAYINWLSKTYGFTAEILSDFEKLTNINLRKFKYNDKISAIIAGPMPHSIKGMGGYSSGLEMMRTEPGYPPVFECIANDKLKITKTSINKALRDANCALTSFE